MKMSLPKIPFLFLALLTASPMALADDYESTLGDDPSFVGHYLVTCDGATEHLYFQVTAGQPVGGPVVSAQVRTPDNLQVKNFTDPHTGDGGSSRNDVLHGGPGVYEITVDKSGAGRVSFSLLFHCEDKSGTHTGTTIVSRSSFPD